MWSDQIAQFINALKGLTEPEEKRKAIGGTFIDVFQDEALHIQDVKWLAQGTIYPDVIESISVYGPSAKIKSHHNVGGLPEKMHLKIVEPLRKLFKDEVRKVGGALNLPEHILQRHPFPGPGDKKALETGTTLTPRFDAQGLVTAVVTDFNSGELLMVAHMNAEALAKTLASLTPEASS